MKEKLIYRAFQNRYGSNNDMEDHIESFHKLTSEEQNAVIENPGHVDEAIWEKAKKAAQKSNPDNKWALTMYLYEKMGGK